MPRAFSLTKQYYLCLCIIENTNTVLLTISPFVSVVISWSGPGWVFVSCTESLWTGDCPQCWVLSVLAVELSRAGSPSVDSRADHSYSSYSHLKTLCAETPRILKLQLLLEISNQFDAFSDQKVLLWSSVLGNVAIYRACDLNTKWSSQSMMRVV